MNTLKIFIVCALLIGMLCGCSGNMDKTSSNINEDSTMKDDIKNAGNDVLEGAGDVTNGVSEGVGDVGKGISEGVEDAGKAVGDGVKDLGKE